MPDSSRATSLGELAALFLRLGTTAFGGPAAHIAMLEDEVVRRRRWLSRDRFLDYVGATYLIPGPNSTELAIHIGYTRRGWPGLLVAGSCFIAPAAAIVTLVAWAYVRYGSLSRAVGLMSGVTPVVIAIVVQALWQLGRTAIKCRGLALVAVLATGGLAAGAHELLILASAGIAWMLVAGGARKASAAAAAALLASHPTGAAAFVAAAAPAVSLWTMTATFVKIGSVLFGSGYVLLAFLRADFVDRFGWLSDKQLLDAVAVGQVTPGPVFTTATFIGYVLGGFPGAALATAGIFLPAFVFVALSAPIVPRIRRSRRAGAALDGVNVASLALMAVVSWRLGHAVLTAPLPIALAIASFVALVRFRVNSTWLIAVGGVVGIVVGR
ncbi:MAG TPA: chromate efflux transporter [Vicinamibacterales bacterium]|nr:chromate efflux transporter [Vicinamibacterales bacterium]